MQCISAKTLEEKCEATISTREEFICAWITLAKAELGSAEYEGSFWAFQHMYDLVHEQPEIALDLIAEIWGRDQSRSVIQNLSAGPLEDLLAEHGDRMIAAVEKLAKADPKFRKLLGGVWKNAMSDSVWAKVQLIWDRRGWDGIPE